MKAAKNGHGDVHPLDWTRGSRETRAREIIGHPLVWGFVNRQIYQQKSKTEVNVIYILSLTRALCFSSNVPCRKPFCWISVEFPLLLINHCKILFPVIFIMTIYLGVLSSLMRCDELAILSSGAKTGP